MKRGTDLLNRVKATQLTTAVSDSAVLFPVKVCRPTAQPCPPPIPKDLRHGIRVILWLMQDVNFTDVPLFEPTGITWQPTSSMGEVSHRCCLCLCSSFSLFVCFLFYYCLTGWWGRPGRGEIYLAAPVRDFVSPLQGKCAQYKTQNNRLWCAAGF